MSKPPDQLPLIHRRQYIVGPESIAYRPDWTSIEIQRGLFLSFCPSLPVQSINDSEGCTWHILGIAIESDRNRPSVAESISTSRTAQVPALYSSWAGRWALIGGGRIHLDASGFLQCFYVIRGRLWASSSLALLKEILGTALGEPDERSLRRGVGIEWYPLPHTRFSLTRSLLPTQVLSLDSGAIEARQLFSNIDGQADYQGILDRLESSTVNFLQRISERKQRIWISLTAGLDSRVILAAAIKAGISFRTVTFEYSGMSTADRKLPKRLAGRAGVGHTSVSPAAFDAAMLKIFDENCCNNFTDRDRDFFSHGYWRFANLGDIVLKAHCYEVGRCFYWKRFDSPALPDAKTVSEAFGEDSPKLTNALREWLEWVKYNPIEGLDWRDRFYHEQRIAGWCSADMQANDLLDCDILVPGNADSILGDLLSVSAPRRGTGQHQIDLIRRMAPQLLEDPFNRSTSFHPLARLFWFFRYGHYKRMLRRKFARAKHSSRNTASHSK